MTMTTTQAIEAVEAVLAQLRAVEVAPLASDLPPTVAAGELITSAWGNAVITELQRLRGANGGLEMWQVFNHGGGTGSAYGVYDNGTTTLGPYAFPVRVSVMAIETAGYGSFGAAVSADIIRLSDGVTVAQSASEYTKAALYANHTIPGAYDVPVGQVAGFKTRTLFNGSDSTPITIYFSCHGIYLVHRTDY